MGLQEVDRDVGEEDTAGKGGYGERKSQNEEF
jgi:hypothetical protein